MKTVSKALNIARVSFVSWITSKRMLLIPMAVVLFVETTWSPMLALAQENGYLINAIEPYLLLSNEGSMAPLIIIVFIMLMADFPSNTSSGYFILYRINRKGWLLGQMIFSASAAFTWQIIILIISVLMVMTSAFGGNAWSFYTMHFFIDFPDVYINNTDFFIDSSVYTHFQPMQALLLTLLLQWLSMFLASGIIMLFKLMNRHFGGLVCAIAVYAMGMMTWALVSPLMWIFPTANSVVGWHYNLFYADATVSVWYSLIYFLVLIIAVLIICYVRIEKYTFSELYCE